MAGAAACVEGSLRVRMFRVTVLAAGVTGALPGCVVQVVQAPSGVGGDSCAAQSVAFLNLAQGSQPAGGIAPGRWADGGPPVQADLAAQLAAENALLERLQIAFDALLYCRWIELRTIRADAAGGRLGRATAQAQLTSARARLVGELEQGRRAAIRVQEQGRALERGAERTARGLPAALGTARAGLLQAVAAATVPLRLRPDPAAPEVGRIAGGRSVTLRAAPSGFALIEAADGAVGYAPVAAFNLSGRGPVAPAGSSFGSGDLRSLVATNLARRENFAESVDLSGCSLAAAFEEAI